MDFLKEFFEKNDFEMQNYRNRLSVRCEDAMIALAEDTVLDEGQDMIFLSSQFTF